MIFISGGNGRTPSPQHPFEINYFDDESDLRS